MVYSIQPQIFSYKQCLIYAKPARKTEEVTDSPRATLASSVEAESEGTHLILLGKNIYGCLSNLALNQGVEQFG